MANSSDGNVARTGGGYCPFAADDSLIPSVDAALRFDNVCLDGVGYVSGKPSLAGARSFIR